MVGSHLTFKYNILSKSMENYILMMNVHLSLKYKDKNV